MRAGQQLELPEIQLRKGVKIGLRLPPVPLVGTALELSLWAPDPKAKDGRRLVIREHRIYGHMDGPVVNTLMLMPGRYLLVVKNLAGRQAKTTFTVEAGAVKAGDKKPVVDVQFPRGGR